MCGSTYVNEIGQVVDEVLVYRRVGRLQAEDVLVSRLERLQLRLLVLALPLKGTIATIRARAHSNTPNRLGPLRLINLINRPRPAAAY